MSSQTTTTTTTTTTVRNSSNNDTENRVPMTLRDHFWDDPFFSGAWDDFDTIREKMMQESRNMMKMFDEELSRMDKSVLRSSSIDCKKNESGGESGRSLDLYNDFHTPFMFPRRWMMPRVMGEDFAKNFNSFISNDDQVIRLVDKDDKFEINLDTHQYRPDELKVNVKDNIISIDGKHEEKSEDGSKFISRQFSRKYTMPAGCKAETVNSNLSSDGVLIITAPKVPPITNEGDRKVPITMK